MVVAPKDKIKAPLVWGKKGKLGLSCVWGLSHGHNMVRGDGWNTGEFLVDGAMEKIVSFSLTEDTAFVFLLFW